MLTQRDIIKSAAFATIWSLTYLFIRRKLNPDNQSIDKWRKDALYGGLSSFIAGLLKTIISLYL